MRWWPALAWLESEYRKAQADDVGDAPAVPAL
jgi:hypothetical protein